MDDLLRSLSGEWKVLKDPDGRGAERGWAERIPPEALDTVPVPGDFPRTKTYRDYTYDSLYPGWGGWVWHYRTFSLDPVPEGLRPVVEFDDAGYVTEAYLNGKFLGRHEMEEEPFSFDAAKAARTGENLLAVRAFHPTPEEPGPGGVGLHDIPHYVDTMRGGLRGEVRLRLVPAVRLTGVWLRPDAETGAVTAEVELENAGQAAFVLLNAVCAEGKSGCPVCTAQEEVSVPEGTGSYTIAFTVPERKLWDIDSPSLYSVSFFLNGTAERTVRFGFRTLGLRNGYFTLNGRRFFLKSTHFAGTAEEVAGIKAMGFNACRFLSHTAEPQVLDLCDEIGLLVIESPVSGWGMTDHPGDREQLFACMDHMILRDRNHPSVMAWYVFNELAEFGAPGREGRASEREVFRAGADYITRLRELDPDRVALLSSGRWDGRREIGSVSAPGSAGWDNVRGAEGDPSFRPELWDRNFTNTFTDLDGLGDLHPYARMPMDGRTRRWFRTVGRGTGPVFLSEMGNGSQTNPVRRLRLERIRSGGRDTAAVRYWERLSHFLEEFLEKNGFRDIYPLPELFCEETERLNERQREEVFDVVRANPMFCGYSLTSWGVANEGTLEAPGILKPGQAHALQTGWAPLRWSVFPESRVVHADRPFRLEAALCNEDVLAPGEYPAAVRICGGGRTVYEKDFTLRYPGEGYGGMPPLAADVLDETLSVPAGEYRIFLKLLEGGDAAAGSAPLTAVKTDPGRAPGKSCALWGLSEGAEAVLRENGVSVRRFEDVRERPDLVLAGMPADPGRDWERLTDMVKAGTTAVFLRPEFFLPAPKTRRTQLEIMPGDVFREEMAGENPYLTCLAGKDARCASFHNWLYHMDTIHAEHPVFRNTTPAGVLDLETWGDLCPEKLFLHMRRPDEVLAAGIGLRIEIEDDTAESQALCAYRLGAGRAVISGLAIDREAGRHPFADQMLLNLVSEYGS